MTNPSYSPKVPCVVFGSSIGSMKDELRRLHDATDDELAYLEQISSLRMKKREPLAFAFNGYSSPSVVIDDFLYHGDLKQASNCNLLKKLNIQHIINISDYELDQTIQDSFHILWINFYDDMGENIQKHFEETNQFLHECQLKNEKVLVHCQMGISRSSSIVLAYLIKYHHDTLYKAYDYLLERRRIAAPNLSFLLQLIRYENELRSTKPDKKTLIS